MSLGRRNSQVCIVLTLKFFSFYARAKTADLIFTKHVTFTDVYLCFQESEDEVWSSCWTTSDIDLYLTLSLCPWLFIVILYCLQIERGDSWNAFNCNICHNWPLYQISLNPCVSFREILKHALIRLLTYSLTKTNKTTNRFFFYFFSKRFLGELLIG